MEKMGESHLKGCQGQTTDFPILDKLSLCKVESKLKPKSVVIYMGASFTLSFLPSQTLRNFSYTKKVYSISAHCKS